MKGTHVWKGFISILIVIIRSNNTLKTCIVRFVEGSTISTWILKKLKNMNSRMASIIYTVELDNSKWDIKFIAWIMRNKKGQVLWIGWVFR